MYMDVGIKGKYFLYSVQLFKNLYIYLEKLGSVQLHFNWKCYEIEIQTVHLQLHFSVQIEMCHRGKIDTTFQWLRMKIMKILLMILCGLKWLKSV